MESKIELSLFFVHNNHFSVNRLEDQLILDNSLSLEKPNKEEIAKTIGKKKSEDLFKLLLKLLLLLLQSAN